MTIVVEHTTDPREAQRAAGGHLRSRPVEHNVALSILEARMADDPMPGHYWWAVDDGETVSYAFVSPPDFYAGITPTSRAGSDAMAEAMTTVVPDLHGIIGDAATAAAFASTWAGLLHTPAHPESGQRIYRLGTLVPPRGVPGSLRAAVDDDRDTLLRWTAGFDADTGLGHPGTDVDGAVEHNLRAGRLCLWEHDGPVSMALTRAPAAGVARVGLVYTPPERRGRGYASACVAAISERVLTTDSDQCILYTQLANPTSNAIYAALGYEPVSEVVAYRFG